MNIKEYISSGIVESYVLGLASPEERVEFERLCRQYPELVEARDNFERSLENQFATDRTVPIPEMKARVMAAVREDQESISSKVLPISRREPNPGFWAKWLAAASVLLVLVSGYLAYNFYAKSKDLQLELERSRNAQAQMDERIEKLEEDTRIMKDPNMAVVNMVGTEKAPASSANVYWDSTSQNVYLVVKNMPKLASDKQYQLWALIDGQPKDLGLFDVQDENKLILKMNNTQKADAFAITIETRGNKGGPTLEQLQTMGKTRL